MEGKSVRWNERRESFVPSFFFSCGASGERKLADVPISADIQATFFGAPTVAVMRAILRNEQKN